MRLKGVVIGMYGETRIEYTEISSSWLGREILILETSVRFRISS